MLPILIATGIAAAVGVVGVREHRALRASRRNLLAECAPRLDDGTIESGSAEFPKLIGTARGRSVRAELIPDTMTIRRLPQLWLSVTLLEPLPVSGGIAVLVRPSGNDYYSLTESFSVTLNPPGQLPWEVIVRGARDADQNLIERLAPCIGAILTDPKIKEVAVTSKGVRIVRQAGEGRHGEHLLLRQAIFDDAIVPATDFDSILVNLDTLCAEVTAGRATVRAA